MVTLEEWLEAKTKEYENDIGYQREKLLYLLGERVAILRGIERLKRMDTDDFFCL